MEIDDESGGSDPIYCDRCGTLWLETWVVCGKCGGDCHRVALRGTRPSAPRRSSKPTTPRKAIELPVHRGRRRPGDPLIFDRWPADPAIAPLIDLPLSVRTLNLLIDERYWPASLSAYGMSRPTVAGDIAKFKGSHLLRIQGFGRTSLEEVRWWLRCNGMDLSPEENRKDRNGADR